MKNRGGGERRGGQEEEEEGMGSRGGELEDERRGYGQAEEKRRRRRRRVSTSEAEKQTAAAVCEQHHAAPQHLCINECHPRTEQMSFLPALFTRANDQNATRHERSEQRINTGRPWFVQINQSVQGYEYRRTATSSSSPSKGRNLLR